MLDLEPTLSMDQSTIEATLIRVKLVIYFALIRPMAIFEPICKRPFIRTEIP